MNKKYMILSTIGILAILAMVALFMAPAGPGSSNTSTGQSAEDNSFRR